MSVTSPSTLPVPHSSSPAPDSLSPSSLESQTLVATVERVSSTSRVATLKRRTRGEYLNKNIPKDPSKRKLIHIVYCEGSRSVRGNSGSERGSKGLGKEGDGEMSMYMSFG
ncbi:hypothetical protein Tco_0070049 [Tanacetum coccineum]